MKKKVIIVIAIVLICVALVIAIMFKNKEEINNKSKSMQTIQITDFNIDNRVTLKKENNLLLGNNTKELENNFYDIKITNTSEGVEVYLNKLWYENYGQDYIQDEYLAKICRELSSKLNVQETTEEFEYLLYKYVKDNYIKVRQGENIEEIQTDKLSLKFELEDSVAKLIIRGCE